MRPVLTLAVVLSLLSGCGSDGEAQPEAIPDSVLGASKLPGAAGVRGALNAADSAAVRRAREDSAARAP